MYVLLKYGRKKQKLLVTEFFIVFCLYLSSVILMIMVKDLITLFICIGMSLFFVSWVIILHIIDIKEIERKIRERIWRMKNDIKR